MSGDARVIGDTDAMDFIAAFMRSYITTVPEQEADGPVPLSIAVLLFEIVDVLILSGRTYDAIMTPEEG